MLSSPMVPCIRPFRGNVREGAGQIEIYRFTGRYDEILRLDGCPRESFGILRVRESPYPLGFYVCREIDGALNGPIASRVFRSPKEIQVRISELIENKKIRIICIGIRRRQFHMERRESRRKIAGYRRVFRDRNASAVGSDLNNGAFVIQYV
jgi:hypothetical protein